MNQNLTDGIQARWAPIWSQAEAVSTVCVSNPVPGVGEPDAVWASRYVADWRFRDLLLETRSSLTLAETSK